MKDLVQFGNRQEQISLSCKACTKTNHLILDCPYLKLNNYLFRMVKGTPNRAKVLIKHKKNVL